MHRTMYHNLFTIMYIWREEEEHISKIYQPYKERAVTCFWSKARMGPQTSGFEIL